MPTVRLGVDSDTHARLAESAGVECRLVAIFLSRNLSTFCAESPLFVQAGLSVQSRVEVETKHVIMTLLIGKRFEMTFYNATLYVMDVKTRHKLFITKPTRIGT